MSKLQNFLNSQGGQFIIGGSTVSGISFLSNNMGPLLGGIFGGIPIGLPSAVFIDDKKVSSYLGNLSFMSIILSTVTLIAYYLITYKKMDKNQAIKISMTLWFLFAFIYYLFRSYFG